MEHGRTVLRDHSNRKWFRPTYMTLTLVPELCTEKTNLNGIRSMMRTWLMLPFTGVAWNQAVDKCPHKLCGHKQMKCEQCSGKLGNWQHPSDIRNIGRNERNHSRCTENGKKCQPKQSAARRSPHLGRICTRYWSLYALLCLWYFDMRSLARRCAVFTRWLRCIEWRCQLFLA